MRPEDQKHEERQARLEALAQERYGVRLEVLAPKQRETLAGILERQEVLEKAHLAQLAT